MGTGTDNLKYYLRHKPKLIKKLESMGISGCELRLEGCMGQLFSTLAHRHKRNWYYHNKELLVDINHVVVACQPCHEKIEHDRDLTESIFEQLRP